MKTTIFIFNQIKTFHECLDSLKSNILDYNGCDIFLHFHKDGFVDEVLCLGKPKKTHAPTEIMM